MGNSDDYHEIMKLKSWNLHETWGNSPYFMGNSHDISISLPGADLGAGIPALELAEPHASDREKHPKNAGLHQKWWIYLGKMENHENSWIYLGKIWKNGDWTILNHTDWDTEATENLVWIGRWISTHQLVIFRVYVNLPEVISTKKLMIWKYHQDPWEIRVGFIWFFFLGDLKLSCSPAWHLEFRCNLTCDFRFILMCVCVYIYICLYFLFRYFLKIQDFPSNGPRIEWYFRWDATGYTTNNIWWYGGCRKTKKTMYRTQSLVMFQR